MNVAQTDAGSAEVTTNTPVDDNEPAQSLGEAWASSSATQATVVPDASSDCFGHWEIAQSDEGDTGFELDLDYHNHFTWQTLPKGTPMQLSDSARMLSSDEGSYTIAKDGSARLTLENVAYRLTCDAHAAELTPEASINAASKDNTWRLAHRDDNS